ncbi:MAG: hypothetical protein MZW92_15425 [Comamonadaceae bacterium]|nr:hypothetical protein [Comamonadaceae bacterium]
MSPAARANGRQAHAGQPAPHVSDDRRSKPSAACCAATSCVPAAPCFEVAGVAAPARARAGRGSGHAALGLRVADRRQAVSRARPGTGDGGRAHRRTSDQAGHHPLVAHDDAGRGLRRG